MQDLSQYRVVSRKKFAIVMVVLLSFVAVGVWIGLDHLAIYADQLEERATTDPAEVAAIVTQLLQSLAILNGLVFGSFTMIIIWRGWRGWREKSMPPTGSWVLEGQRTWTGEPAVRIAKFTIAVGALLGVLAVVSSLILLGLGDTVVDTASKGA